ncbi:hypothetical protein F7R21_29485 [Burkholderia latens]|uniref:Uncharacterized protein n=1 Tax=Burkholderia latens TaxID=488446 RepID=A0A6H9T4Y0_9BURK|nr:hypothetical protein F7R21_29485 [Burkholderia latens]
MPRTASAGAAFLFSLHAHRHRRARHACDRRPRLPAADPRRRLPAPLLPACRSNAATWCGNSPRFLL